MSKTMMKPFKKIYLHKKTVSYIYPKDSLLSDSILLLDSNHNRPSM